MWSKKHVGIEFYFTSTADDETSEKELETCYASSDSSEDEDSPQEAEVNMTESVVLPGRQGHRSDLLVGTKCIPCCHFTIQALIMSTCQVTSYPTSKRMLH